MFTLVIALSLIVIMLILGLGSSVLWMRPANRRIDIAPRETQPAESTSGSMTLPTERPSAA